MGVFIKVYHREISIFYQRIKFWKVCDTLRLSAPFELETKMHTDSKTLTAGSGDLTMDR